MAEIPPIGGPATKAAKPLRVALCWAVAVAIQSIVGFAGVAFPQAFGFPGRSAFFDEESYFAWASSILAGAVPYRDFVVEYPPLSLPFFVGPMLLDGRQFRAYTFAFAFEMIAVNALLAGLVAREVGRSGGIRGVVRGLAWYTAFFAILCPMDVTRFDLVPALAAFAASSWFARGRMSSGGIAAGLGVLAKFVPGLVILPVLVASGTWRPKVRVAVVFGLVVAVGVIGWRQIGGVRAWEAIRYHSDRGIEIGSPFSSAFIAAHLVGGLELRPSYDHSSISVVGRGTEAASRLAPILQAACLLLVVRRSWGADPGQSIRLGGAAILAYVAVGKVLSPQYLVWLIPFVVASGTRRERLLFLTCCGLTTALYPWSFEALCGFRPWAEILLVARNVGLLGLFASMLGRGESRTGLDPPGDPW